MFFKIAWRNLWRNKRRSAIILTSIIVGVTAMLLNDSFSRGMIDQMLEKQISSHVSHIQIHKKGFDDNINVHKLIPNPEKIDNILSNTSFIKNHSKRVFVYGLLSSANASAGAAIVGIEPNKESKITDIHSKIKFGEYLTGAKHEVLIGEKMAEKLEVEIGDKVVSVVSNINGDVSNELYRIVGIYDTGANDFDKTYIYIPLKTAQSMLGIGAGVHEFATITDNPKLVVEYKDTLISEIDGKYEILTYQEKLPMMMTWLDMYDQMIYIIYIIISIAVLFGIVNIMLMSVFERVNEFGVLLSIGMKRIKIFSMVLQEAFVLGLFGTIIGFFVGLAIYYYFSIYGIDFSAYEEGLSSFGMSNILYPAMSIEVIINSLLIMPFVTVIGAIYPASKAVRLQPVEAMRYV